MIAAISTILHDEDIAPLTVAHLFNNGVDEVYIALGPDSEPTRESLAPFPVTIIDDPEPFHYQPRWMNWLAQGAREAGAEWVIPFDADEFWCAEHPPQTIKDVLEGLEPNIGWISAASFRYRDFNYRCNAQQPINKVAFRPYLGTHLANGNHAVSGVPGEIAHGVLVVREIQYRDHDQFVTKMQTRNRTIDPDLPDYEGAHHRTLASATPAELQDKWNALYSEADVWDPIPLLG